MQLAELIALTHHERWDGTGYPAGLAGEGIPLEGRIAAVCDVYDALVSPRPYKRAWSVQEACDEIARQRGHHFDAVVADALLRVVGDRGWSADLAQSEAIASAAARSPERMAPSM
jgi:putative two-component system response regulator